MGQQVEFTAVEHWIDERAHRFLDARASGQGLSWVVEFVVFGLKQA